MRTDVGIMPMDTLSTFALIFWSAWFTIGAVILALSNGLVQHMLDTAAKDGQTRSDMPDAARKAQAETLTALRRASIAYIFLGPIGLLVYFQQYAFLRGTYGPDRVRMTLRFQKPYSPILDAPEANPSDAQRRDAP